MGNYVIHYDLPLPGKLVHVKRILFPKLPQIAEPVDPEPIVALTPEENRRHETALMIVGGAVALTIAGLAFAAAVAEIRRNRRLAREKEQAEAEEEKTPAQEDA